MSNLLEQWNEHIVRGNQLSRELEDFEGIIGAGELKDSEIAFVQKGIGTTYISVLSPEKMNEYKHLVLNAIIDAREEKECELKKLMGMIPVIPSLPKGTIIGIVGQGKPIPHILPPDTPEVVIPEKRKPATINPEFEAAVQDMVDSVKKKPKEDSILPEEPINHYPAKKKSKYLEEMTEKVVKEMYIDKHMKSSEIANHFGVSIKQVENFISRHKLGRKQKQPAETERP